MSHEMALIAMPTIVRLTIKSRMIMSTREMAITTICKREIDMSPKVQAMLGMNAGMCLGYGLRASVKFSRKRPTPSAVMIAETLGAWRSGLYASRSIVTPRRAVPSMETTRVGDERQIEKEHRIGSR